MRTINKKIPGLKGPFIIHKNTFKERKIIMETQNLMQYASYLLIAISVMAFFVSVITQVIKSWPKLDKLPTSVVVIVLSLILCPVTFIALMSYLRQSIEWYMVFACVMAAFIVALVAMDGWERIKEIWNRSKYNKEG